MTRKLAVVTDETARPTRKKREPATIKQAAESSERELLVAMRSHLAAQLDKGAVPAHALAGVMAKLREYDRDIRAIDLREKQEAESGGEVDDEAFDASAI